MVVGFSARASGSLAGGFLVAVAGCAPLLCCCSCLVQRDFRWNGPVLRFTFSPAQWASLQLNGPVQLFSDRDSRLTGPYWLEGRRRKKKRIGPSCGSIGDFTDIAMKENHVGDKGYVVPPQMRDYGIQARNFDGTFYERVFPFDPFYFCTKVHPTAALLFTPHHSQLTLLQHLCIQFQYAKKPLQLLSDGHYTKANPLCLSTVRALASWIARTLEPSLSRGNNAMACYFGQNDFFFARRPIGSCNLVLFVHHRLMRGEKSVHDSRIGAEPFVHCET